MVLGEKGKAQLQRDRRADITSTVTELGKYKMTFAQVCCCCYIYNAQPPRHDTLTMAKKIEVRFLLAFHPACFVCQHVCRN